ncbi:unnamed protein product [Vicia faba]|uniref:Uncharacterized protein n=1 Tax=Vicia faba TaxID=3906 RepID=A0AAV1AJH6_VICFA|nr:unnamed protein product [Vicia faba]
MVRESDSTENKPTTPEKVVVAATNGELQHLFNTIQIHFILLNSIWTKNLTVLSLFIDRANSLSWLLKPVTESTLQLFVKTILEWSNMGRRLSRCSTFDGYTSSYDHNHKPVVQGDGYGLNNVDPFAFGNFYGSVASSRSIMNT